MDPIEYRLLVCKVEIDDLLIGAGGVRVVTDRDSAPSVGAPLRRMHEYH